MDPNASRETLDHSIMYIFAVALEDADWHHVKSYSRSRAKKKSTIKIWKSIKTHEDKKWTKKYHDPNPKNKCFGAKVIVTMNNGKKYIEELERADAHPYGARPFKRKNYINKFKVLTNNILFAASFKSASSEIIVGLFPPSSIVVGTIFSAV